jgi:hypothetical protein
MSGGPSAAAIDVPAFLSGLFAFVASYRNRFWCETGAVNARLDAHDVLPPNRQIVAAGGDGWTGYAAKLNPAYPRREDSGVYLVAASCVHLGSRRRRFILGPCAGTQTGMATASIQFLERVFMKSAMSYKAALYRDSSLSGGFWTGQAIDKQINNRVAPASNYWIAEFLDSDFSTTAAAGTRRLAMALRNPAKKATNTKVKTEIAAAATLAQSLKGRSISIREFAGHFGRSQAAVKQVMAELPDAALAQDAGADRMFDELVASRAK